jgi:hypothetical protein
MKALIQWFGKACEEAPGVPSTTRAVMLIGALTLLFTICGAWIAACVYTRTLVEIPASVSTTFGTFLAAMLTAKVVQQRGE